MKNNSVLFALAAVVCLFGLNSTASTPAVTVDDFKFGDKAYGGIGDTLFSHSGKLIVTGGWKEVGKSWHNMTRSSTDGTNWVPTPDDDRTHWGSRVILDSAGKFYGISTNGTQWVLNRSRDEGRTWISTPIDQDAYPDTYYNDVKLDSNGNIFIVGKYHPRSSNTEHWVVKESRDGGATWTLIDDYPFELRSLSANKIAFDSFGAIYVVGYADLSNSSTVLHWLVRKSSDLGKHWSTVDDFVYSLDSYSEPHDIAVGPLGEIYVIGEGHYDGNRGSKWIVRRSTDAGNTWKTIDEFQPSGQVHAKASRLLLDPSGKLNVIGFGYDLENSGAGPTYFMIGRWIVRRSQDSGNSWTVADDFRLAPDAHAEPKACVLDNLGNLYVAGAAMDDANVDTMHLHWIVRKLPPQGP